MSVPEVLEALRRDETLRRRIRAWRILPAREARWADFPETLDPRLREALQRLGIQRLYAHQREALDAVSQGAHVLLATPTASGKTLAYNLPVVNHLLQHPEARALYIFPTKALAQDQVAVLQRLEQALQVPLRAHTYDGDTPRDLRRTIRNEGRIVVTNPDMLHKAILPHHPAWMHLFQGLRFVVVDEIHAYRGVFGSHVANVFRRLRRILRHYGTEVQYLATSATIGNPAEHARNLLGEPFQVIRESGAPQGRKHFLFWMPPLVDPEHGIRANYLEETYQLARFLYEHGVKTIVFARSRLNVEVLLEKLKKALVRRADQQGRIASYRGGYLPRERRAIEEGLREGRIHLVVSTNALELGVDIGSLDAAILAGYPGTIASTWQQAGRAGRRQGESLAVLVATAAPVDQFLAQHPEYLFEESPEQALIDPNNLLILMQHLKCAAFELPFQEGEAFGDADIAPLLAFLEEQGVVYKSEGRYHWTSEHFPADEFSLRTVSEENFVVVDQTGSRPRIIGEVDFHSAPMLLHPHAIYLHGGKQYEVQRLDYTERKAYVREVSVEYYTDALDYTRVRVLEPFEEAVQGPVAARFGDVLVTRKVVGFKKVRMTTFENVGFGRVHLPEDEMHTTAFWLTLEPEVFQGLGLDRRDLELGLWGILHLLRSLGPLFLMCDPNDLGVHLGTERGTWATEPGNPLRLEGAPEGASPEFRPTLYVYETFPGGTGLAEGFYVARQRILEAALERVRSCGCDRGCPSCVGPALYGNRKQSARLLLERILARTNPEDL